MNDKKREETGLLAIWDVNEWAHLAPKAFAEVNRLLP